MKAIREALKSNGFPENHVHPNAHLAKPLPGSPGTIRTELFQVYPLHDKPRRNQAIGFKDAGDVWSSVVTFAGHRVHFKRLRKIFFGGGGAGFSGKFGLVLAAPADPDVLIDLILPWSNDDHAIGVGPKTVEGLLHDEAAEAAKDLDIDPDQLWEQISPTFSPFLPTQQPEGWEIFMPTRELHLSEGEERAIEIEFNCPTDGACMFALKVQDVADDDESLDDNGYFVSDPVAMVIEQGEVSFLFAGEDYEVVVEQAYA
jgi:hypothetical protein